MAEEKRGWTGRVRQPMTAAEAARFLAKRLEAIRATYVLHVAESEFYALPAVADADPTLRPRALAWSDEKALEAQKWIAVADAYSLAIDALEARLLKKTKKARKP